MTEEQKELVVLAAKAMGYDSRFGFNTCKVSKGTYGEWVDWNPITSDADCFRMETELEIDIMWLENGVEADLPGHGIRIYEPFVSAKAATRRLASTKVAAEIQRRKENKE